MKHQKLMITTLSIAVLILTIFIIGKINVSIKFSKQVKELFAESKSIPDQRFHKDQLDGLPEPVQRYFNHILKDEQPYISYAELNTKDNLKQTLIRVG
ncbi:MAG: DUF6544 family protein [Cyclobacteriaceae bacterium]